MRRYTFEEWFSEVWLRLLHALIMKLTLWPKKTLAVSSAAGAKRGS
jgi:hypothetical protein